MTMIDDKLQKGSKVYIYTRVSTGKQVTEGHGLEGQLKECQAYCFKRGLEIQGHFEDAGISGRKGDQAGLKELYSLLAQRRNKKEKIYILSYSLSRIARNHGRMYQAIIESRKNNFEFIFVKEDLTDDAVGNFQLNVLTSVYQFEAEMGAERVKEKMNVQKCNGRRVHGKAPAWYKYEGGEYKPFQPNAKIVGSMYERLATGELSRAKRELREYMASEGFVDKRLCLRGPTNHQIDTLFKERIIMECAGYLQGENEWIPAKHEPIITLELARKVIAKLNERGDRKHRQNLNAEYPLKGTLLCDGCERPMSAYAPNKGKYVYYECRTYKCRYKNKSVSRDVVHDEFIKLLEQVEPKPEVLRVVAQLMKDAWKERTASMKGDVLQDQGRVRLCEQRLEKAVQDSLQAPNDAVRAALYKEIERLTEEKAQLVDLIQRKKITETDFEKALDRVQVFLKNPKSAWLNGTLRMRKMIQTIVFADKLRYVPKEGFRNAEKALPFRVFELMKGVKNKMVVECSALAHSDAIPCYSPIYSVFSRVYRERCLFNQ